MSNNVVQPLCYAAEVEGKTDQVNQALARINIVRKRRQLEQLNLNEIFAVIKPSLKKNGLDCKQYSSFCCSAKHLQTPDMALETHFIHDSGQVKIISSRIPGSMFAGLDIEAQEKLTNRFLCQPLMRAFNLSVSERESVSPKRGEIVLKADNDDDDNYTESSRFCQHYFAADAKSAEYVPLPDSGFSYDNEIDPIINMGPINVVGFLNADDTAPISEEDPTTGHSGPLDSQSSVLSEEIATIMARRNGIEKPEEIPPLNADDTAPISEEDTTTDCGALDSQSSVLSEEIATITGHSSKGVAAPHSSQAIEKPEEIPPLFDVTTSEVNLVLTKIANNESEDKDSFRTEVTGLYPALLEEKPESHICRVDFNNLEQLVQKRVIESVVSLIRRVRIEIDSRGVNEKFICQYMEQGVDVTSFDGGNYLSNEVRSDLIWLTEATDLQWDTILNEWKKPITLDQNKKLVKMLGDVEIVYGKEKSKILTMLNTECDIQIKRLLDLPRHLYVEAFLLLEEYGRENGTTNSISTVSADSADASDHATPLTPSGTDEVQDDEVQDIDLPKENAISTDHSNPSNSQHIDFLQENDVLTDVAPSIGLPSERPLLSLPCDGPTFIKMIRGITFADADAASGPIPGKDKYDRTTGKEQQDTVLKNQEKYQQRVREAAELIGEIVQKYSDLIKLVNQWLEEHTIPTLNDVNYEQLLEIQEKIVSYVKHATSQGPVLSFDESCALSEEIKTLCIEDNGKLREEDEEHWKRASAAMAKLQSNIRNIPVLAAEFANIFPEENKPTSMRQLSDDDFTHFRDHAANKVIEIADEKQFLISQVEAKLEQHEITVQNMCEYLGAPATAFEFYHSKTDLNFVLGLTDSLWKEVKESLASCSTEDSEILVTATEVELPSNDEKELLILEVDRLNGDLQIPADSLCQKVAEEEGIDKLEYLSVEQLNALIENWSGVIEWWSVVRPITLKHGVALAEKCKGKVNVLDFLVHIHEQFGHEATSIGDLPDRLFDKASEAIDNMICVAELVCA